MCITKNTSIQPWTVSYTITSPIISDAVTCDYWMDNPKKLICSSRGHKGHLGKFLSTTEDILSKLSTAKEHNAEGKLTSSNAILLAENLKQLNLKAHVFKELDNKMIANTEDKIN